MAKILDLPDIVIGEICKYLDPRDLEAIHLACKRFHALSDEATVKHQINKRLLRVVNDRFPNDILYILKNNLPWYIQQIVFYNDCTHRGDFLVSDVSEMDQDELDTTHSDGDREQLQAVIDDSAIVPAADKRKWLKEIQRGSDGPLKALLTFLSPNLKCLVFAAYKNPEDFALKYLSETLRRFAFLPNPQYPACFNSLTKVYLNHIVVESQPRATNISLSCVASFLTLPAIKELVVGKAGHVPNKMARLALLRDTNSSEGWEPEPLYSWEFAPRSSPALCLDVGNCTFDDGELASLLSGIKALKSFRFAHPQYMYMGPEEPLVRYFAESLETLYLGKIVQYTISCLHGFQVLKHVGLHVDQILDLKYAGKERYQKMRLIKLSDVLPASLETFQVIGDYRRKLEVESLLDGLMELVKTKSSSNPNLQGICIGMVQWLLEDADSARRARAENLSGVAGIPSCTELSILCESNGVVLNTRTDGISCAVCPVRSPLLGEGIDIPIGSCSW